MLFSDYLDWFAGPFIFMIGCFAGSDGGHRRALQCR